MRTLALSTLTLAALVLVSSSTPPASSDAAIDLFNGENLEGWSHFLVDDTVPRESVWSVSEGVLICKGTPVGYLYTDASYHDFRLTLDWRWAPGQEPGNSGVLLRIHGAAKSFLPQCVEAQLQHGNAGDIWAFYGAAVQGDEKRSAVVLGHDILGDFKGIHKAKAAEKAPGEWNHYEIVMRGRSLEVFINGERVNEAWELDVRSGPIGLQSEGGEIHFRNVRLEKL